MPSFRGVNKDDILSSLQNTAQFITELAVGPACTDKVAPWLNGEKIDRISGAETDEELVRAIQETGAEYAFSGTYVMTFLQDLADRNVPESRDVIDGLRKWGASEGPYHYGKRHAIRPQIEEIEQYVTSLPPRDHPRYEGVENAIQTYLLTTDILITGFSLDDPWLAPMKEEALAVDKVLRPLHAKGELPFMQDYSAFSGDPVFEEDPFFCSPRFDDTGFPKYVEFRGTERAAAAVAAAFPDRTLLSIAPNGLIRGEVNFPPTHTHGASEISGEVTRERNR